LPVGPADQRSQIKTFNIAPSWTRLLSSATVFTLGGFVRRDAYNYYPSANPFADLGAPALQSETVSQRRTLLNAGLRSDISYVKGIHNLKAGATYEQTFLDEKDPFGIVDPTLNAPCLDANGAPVFVGNPALNNPSQCPTAGTTNPILYPAPFIANPGFDPLLGCYDLTRPTPSPADGCPTSTSGLYTFNGHTDVKELALYVQDSITKGNWALNLGLRGDFYNGLTTHKEAEPRLGVAYNIKRSNTVLRVSYARTMETPFNENLVLSNNGCANPVLGPLLACTVPGITPFTPGWRNEFHAGLQQAFGRYVVFSGEYIWKYTHNAYDFSVLGATPITFPIEWDRSKIPGYAGRVSVPNLHGFSALMVFSSVAARFFTPQLGGAGAVPSAALAGGSVPFRIDHDEKFNLTAHMQYQPWKLGPWLGFNWRYDSGLVAGPAPCAGGNCANGPLGSDTVVDTSGLSPDQQFESGLFCGSVRPTLPSATNPIGTPLSSSLGTNLCPASQYGSTLLQIPAPGTENDDHNPPRIASRSLFDIAVGDDNLFKGERYKWSLTLTAINVANKYALYNFLSTFSGTHYVTPRSLTAQIGFHF
jgi:TonB dependent receptor